MRKSRIRKSKQLKLVEYFVAGAPARTAGELVGGTKTPAAYYFHRRRELISRAVADAKAVTLLPSLKERIVPDSIGYSDALPSDNALDVSGCRHLRINHSKGFAAGKITSTASRTSGIKPSATCGNLTVCPKRISPCS